MIRSKLVSRLAVATVTASQGLVVASVSAQTSPATDKVSSLSWTRLDGAEACTGTVDIAKRVEVLLRRAAIVSSASAELSIEGRVERTLDGRFRATIVLAKSNGEILGRREIETHGESCQELDEPASLAVALMIDPDALSRPPPPDPPVIVVVPPPDPPKIPSGKGPAPAEISGPPLRFEGYLGAYIALGLAPFGGGLIAGVALDPPFLGAFEGTVTLTESSQHPTTDTSVEFWHFQASGYFCPLAGNISLFQGALCGGGQAGFIAVSTSGFSDDTEKVRPVVNGALRGRVGVWPAPFSFTVGATLGVPILRDSYVYTDRSGIRTTLFEPLPIEAGFDLSIGFKFPEDKPKKEPPPEPLPAELLPPLAPPADVPAPGPPGAQ